MYALYTTCKFRLCTAICVYERNEYREDIKVFVTKRKF